MFLQGYHVNAPKGRVDALSASRCAFVDVLLRIIEKVGFWWISLGLNLGSTPGHPFFGPGKFGSQRQQRNWEIFFLTREYVFRFNLENPL